MKTNYENKQSKAKAKDESIDVWIYEMADMRFGIADVEPTRIEKRKKITLKKSFLREWAQACEVEVKVARIFHDATTGIKGRHDATPQS